MYLFIIFVMLNYTNYYLLHNVTLYYIILYYNIIELATYWMYSLWAQWLYEGLEMIHTVYLMRALYIFGWTYRTPWIMRSAKIQTLELKLIYYGYQMDLICTLKLIWISYRVYIELSPHGTMLWEQIRRNECVRNHELFVFVCIHCIIFHSLNEIKKGCDRSTSGKGSIRFHAVRS